MEDIAQAGTAAVDPPAAAGLTPAALLDGYEQCAAQQRALRSGLDWAQFNLHRMADLDVVGIDVTPYGVNVQVATVAQADILVARFPLLQFERTSLAAQARRVSFASTVDVLGLTIRVAAHESGRTS